MLANCVLFDMLIAKRNSVMAVKYGRSGRYSRGMVGMVACSHACPARYVARFIRVMDQYNIAGAMETYSDCRGRVVVDIIDCLCRKNAL